MMFPLGWNNKHRYDRYGVSWRYLALAVVRARAERPPQGSRHAGIRGRKEMRDS